VERRLRRIEREWAVVAGLRLRAEALYRTFLAKRRDMITSYVGDPQSGSGANRRRLTRKVYLPKGRSLRLPRKHLLKAARLRRRVGRWTRAYARLNGAARKRSFARAASLWAARLHYGIRKSGSSIRSPHGRVSGTGRSWVSR